jgi:hypothetical protein
MRGELDHGDNCGGEAVVSRRREEQDMMDKVILGELRRGDVRWTVLEKKVLIKCHSLATRTRFDNRLGIC